VLKAVVVVVAVLATLGSAAPVGADHAAGAPPGSSPDVSLDLKLRLGAGGFHVGARLLGPEALSGEAWLDGRARDGGFRLHGGVEHGGASHDFSFDADLGDWLHRPRGAWGGSDL
jgi:hypothetical protein